MSTTLKVREITVLKLRYGLDDGESQTLERIGGYLGVTREMIRQIEIKAIKKLRNKLKVLKFQSKGEIVWN